MRRDDREFIMCNVSYYVTFILVMIAMAFGFLILVFRSSLYGLLIFAVSWSIIAFSELIHWCPNQG